MMRTDPRYSRVRTMLEAEAPRDPDGRFEACHGCQRAAYHAGGFLKLLTRDLSRLATFKGNAPGVCPRCGSERVGVLGGVAGMHGLSKCYACRKQFSPRSADWRRNSKVPDATWRRAEELFAGGCSALSAAKELSVTPRTAWLMHKRLATAAITTAEPSNG